MTESHHPEHSRRPMTLLQRFFQSWLWSRTASRSRSTHRSGAEELDIAHMSKKGSWSYREFDRGIESLIYTHSPQASANAQSSRQQVRIGFLSLCRILYAAGSIWMLFSLSKSALKSDDWSQFVMDQALNMGTILEAETPSSLRSCGSDNQHASTHLPKSLRHQRSKHWWILPCVLLLTQYADPRAEPDNIAGWWDPLIWFGQVSWLFMISCYLR